MYERALHTQDGRTFVPITSGALSMHEANERIAMRQLMACAMFTQPDIEIHVDCPKHGHEVVVLVEPMSVAHVLARDPFWANPN